MICIKKHFAVIFSIFIHPYKVEWLFFFFQRCFWFECSTIEMSWCFSFLILNIILSKLFLAINNNFAIFSIKFSFNMELHTGNVHLELEPLFFLNVFVNSNKFVYSSSKMITDLWSFLSFKCEELKIGSLCWCTFKTFRKFKSSSFYFNSFSKISSDSMTFSC